MKLAFVVAAAGSSRRFGADKLSERIGDRTVLETAIASLRLAVPDAPSVVVVAPEHLERWNLILTAGFTNLQVVAGGKRRQDSVRIGVEEAADSGAEVVAIHDGARPLIHPDDVGRVIDSLGDADAAILAASIHDTVKKTDPDGVVVETLNRDGLRLAQTPQIARVTTLESAWRRQDLSREWSDEAALIEAGGGQVRSFEAEHPNPKITTVADLEMVRRMRGDHA